MVLSARCAVLDVAKRRTRDGSDAIEEQRQQNKTTTKQRSNLENKRKAKSEKRKMKTNRKRKCIGSKCKCKCKYWVVVLHSAGACCYVECWDGAGAGVGVDVAATRYARASFRKLNPTPKTVSTAVQRKKTEMVL